MLGVAAKGGVAMMQDDAKTYIYDSDRQTLIIVEKGKWVDDVPLTWVVNVKTGTARHVSPAK